MTTTIMDCAQAVQAIYKNRDFPGFQLIQGFYDPKNRDVGLSAYSVGVYRSLNFAEILISVRGSAKSFTTKDWVDDDVSIGLGRLPDRTNNAVSYIRGILRTYEQQGQQAMIVGHSLGGFIAQFVGVFWKKPFVTFNAPPALKVRSGALPGGVPVGDFKQGLNYRVNYDPVSKAPGKHVGPLVVLPLAGQKHAAAHTGKVVIESVRASGYANFHARTEIARRNR